MTGLFGLSLSSVYPWVLWIAWAVLIGSYLLAFVLPLTALAIIYRYLIVRYVKKHRFRWNFFQVLRSGAPILLSLIFLMMGFITYRIREGYYSDIHYETLVAILLCCFAGLTLLIWNIIKGFHLVFQLENLIIWTSFTVGWALAQRTFWEDLIFSTFAIWIVSAFIGALINGLVWLLRGNKFIMVKAVVRYLNGLFNE